MLIKLLVKSYYIINIAIYPFLKKIQFLVHLALNIGGAILKFYRGYSITLLSPVADNYKLIIIKNFNRLLVKKAYCVNCRDIAAAAYYRSNI